MLPNDRCCFSEQFGITFAKIEAINKLLSIYLIYFNFLFLLYGPAHRSAQAGLQAGPVAEPAGLRVGPGRGQAGQRSEPAGHMAGPGRLQAGPAAEAAGLPAGPGRCHGRAWLGRMARQ